MPGKASEELGCKDGDAVALDAMRSRMAFGEWAATQVSVLRKLGFRVADKATARVLVELHNRQASAAGLVLTGTLACMAWLNELGAIAVTARTLDIDLARRRQLKLGAPLPFLTAMQATGLPFVAVPGLPSTLASTAVQLPGVKRPRVDVLAPGRKLDATVKVPELQWSAQAVPYYDYRLDGAEAGAMLAGGHCIPVRLPQAARFVWHKLYSSTQRRGSPERAAKDRQQALLLGAVLADTDALAIRLAFKEAPAAMAVPIKPLLKALHGSLRKHPALEDVLRECLDG